MKERNYRIDLALLPALLMLITAGLLAGCRSAPTGPRTLTVMTHDSFAASEAVIQAFEEEHDATVEILLSGDAGSAVNQAVLSKNSPLADVLYGIDNSFLSRALDAEIFEAYNSPLLSEIPDEFKLDSQNRVLPVDFGDVCLNYDVAYFEETGLAVPQSLDDLRRPAYRGLLVVENPATSSPGLAFLFATIAEFGEDGYLDYWQDLVENEVNIVNDWETAYYSEFSQWGGADPLVVSYGSSPPFEVLFAETPIDEPPTAAITAPGTCFRQVEFVGILAGTENRDLAEAWVDYMLSTPFQEDIPLQMFVFPVNQNAALDQAFVDFLDVPDAPAQLDPTLIAANRDQWIDDWTQTILR